MSISLLRQILMKEAVKKSAGSSGIMSINKNMAADVDKLLQKYVNDALAQGVDIETLSPDQLKMIVAINQPKTPRVISGTSDEGKAITEKLFGKRGEVVDFPQPRTFKQEIDAMKKSGDIVDPNNLKKNDNVLTREMFQDSNLNKVARDRDRAIKAKARIEEKNEETIMDRINNANNRITEIKKEQEAMYKPKVDTIEETVTYIKTLEPMTALKEANLVIGRKGKYKDLTPDQSKKILQDTEDHIFERDIPDEDFASGGRAGFYTGGITDVEPSLDDIGHGADALNSRTRLMSPGSQTTTSTGLNYLLAEDNDNMRIPFSTGKLAGGIDSAIEKNKNLEERITENKRMTDFLNKKYDERAIKNAPEGVLMDSPPKRKESLIEALKNAGEGTPQDGGAYSLNSDAYSNIIVFDDGTVYYKDTGEYYHKDLGQVTSPGEGAKIKPKEMEAAEGGRIGFAGGGDPKRRAFLKLLATLTGGAAAFKSGLLSLGEGGTKKAVSETVKQAAGSGGQVPPYFLKLVEKIKTLGDDAPKLAVKDREVVTKYKDYTLTEDITTGEKTIQRMKIDDDLKYDASEYYGKPVGEEVYMSYKPGKGQMDETMKGKTPPDEYTEDTSLIRSDRPAEGEVMDTFDGVPDDILKEVEAGSGNVPESFYTGPNAIKKADGGRIGFESGKFVLGKNIYNLLKNNKKIKKAIDNIFGTGDYKLDADMAAESLVELNPKEFNNMLYEDLPDNVRSEIYGAVIGPIQNNALIASRAKKTANTIDISDPKVAEDFTNFMKNHGDPEAQKGIKELEETLLLSNAKRTKGRKDNSAGGIQTMLGE